MQIFTTTLSNGTLVLNRVDGAQVISIQVKTGSQCLLTGSLPFKGIQPTPVALAAGNVFNYAASTSSSPLDGFIITHVSGNIDIVVGF